MAEALKTLKFFSGDIWQRDKNLFADKIAAVLPDILQTLLSAEGEIDDLRKDNIRLQSQLQTAQAIIDRLSRGNDTAKRLEYFAGQRAGALVRIAEILENLK